MILVTWQGLGWSGGSIVDLTKKSPTFPPQWAALAIFSQEWTLFSAIPPNGTDDKRTPAYKLPKTDCFTCCPRPDESEDEWEECAKTIETQTLN